MNKRTSALKYEALLILMSMIWGSTFVAQKIVTQHGVPPMMFNGIRFLMGSVALIPLIRYFNIPLRPQGPAGPLPIKGAMAAGAFLFAASVLQQTGIAHTSIANASFITGFYVPMVPLLGLFLGHKAGKSLWLGIAFCMVGLYYLSVTHSLTIGLGDGLILLCAIMWACQILTVDYIAKRGDPISIAFIQFLTCAALSTIGGFLFESCTLAQLKTAFPAIAYAGFLSVGVAFTLQVICQGNCPPGPSAVIMSMETVFGALAGFIVLNEALSSRAILGCALMLAGMLIVQLFPVIGDTR